MDNGKKSQKISTGINNNNKGQSHRCENVIGGRGSRTGSAMVPLYRALLSYCTLSIVIIPLSVTVWLQFATQILTGGSDHKSPFSVEGPVPLSNTMLTGTRASLPNGISFRPMICSRLRECDRQADRPHYGNICPNRPNNNDNDNNNNNNNNQLEKHHKSVASEELAVDSASLFLPV